MLDCDHTVFTLRSWLHWVDAALAIIIWTVLKVVTSIQNDCETGLRISEVRETFGKVLRSNSEPLSKIGVILFQEYVWKEMTRPIVHGDTVFILEIVKSAANFISSGLNMFLKAPSTSIWPIVLRENDMSSVWFWSTTTLYKPSQLVAPVEDYMTDLVQTSSEATGSSSSSHRTVRGALSALEPALESKYTMRSLLYWT